MTQPQSVCAGILQLDIQKGEADLNLKNALRGIHRLSEKGADLAVLPEMWSCGFDYPHLGMHAKKTPEILDTLSGLAKKSGLMIAGSLPEEDQGNIYNTLYLMDKNGSLSGSYRKIHLFEPNQEKLYFQPGDHAQVCETSAGPVGLMTCFDLRFPELCRFLALDGARMVIISAQWPQSRIQHWDILLQARAIENQIFIVAANSWGRDDQLKFPGHSQIISPTGERLAYLEDAEAETTATLEFINIFNARKQFDCLLERVPSAYGL